MTLVPKRWRWRIASAVGVLLVALIFAHAVWLIVASRRLAAATAALAAAGEPVTAADLHLDVPNVDDADNASLDYQRAAALVVEALPAWNRFDDLSYEPNGFTLPWTADERATVADLCRDQSAALTAAAAARGKPAGTWHDRLDPMQFITPGDPMGLSSTRRLANLICYAAPAAAIDGDAATAVARLTDAVVLADAAQHRPTLLAHLVATGMTAAAAEAVDRTMPLVTVTPALRPAVVALRDRLQDERPMAAGTQLGWRSERMNTTQVLRDMADGKPGTPSLLPDSAVARYAFRPMIVGDAALIAPDVDGVRRAAIAPDWPAAQRQLPTELAALRTSRPYLHVAALIFGANYESAVRGGYRAIANRRLAAVAVAARLFAADHSGRVPTAWPDLVPAYLPAVPTDAMDGRPMRIATDPPRAWSVGDDGIDDGGVPVDPRAPMSKRHGDDVAYFAVHPRPAK